jgi:serine/threonine protein kinase
MACAIPDYELLRVVGRGAYGEVWLARTLTGSYVALKTVARAAFDHDRPYDREFEGIKRFEPVSRSDPSQVPILHVGQGDGFFYYAMELADNLSGDLIDPETYTPHTIREDLKRVGRLPVPQCVEVGLALAQALAHLHRCGLVHRDIKPSNVIFVKGVPKLADIGLVTGVGATRSFVGTDGYVPPEGPGTPQADIYSLGKLLYELSTGLDRNLWPEPPADLATRPDRECLLEFNAILHRACAPEPRSRYANAEAMLAELETLQRGASVRLRHARQRTLRCLGKGAVAVGALSAITAVAWTLALWKTAPPPVRWSRNDAANDEYNSALLSYHLGSEESYLQATKHFQSAIGYDTNFAAAYAGLALVDIWLGAPTGNSERLLEAQVAAQKAVALDPQSGLGQATVGLTGLVFGRDWKGAEEKLSYALKLAPDSEDILYEYANFLLVAGRTSEAVRMVEKAGRSGVHSALRLQNAGWIFLAAGQYERAISKFDGLIEKEPSSALRLAQLRISAYCGLRDYPKAIQTEKEAALLRGEDAVEVKQRFGLLEDALKRGGPPAYWQQQLDWSSNDEHHPVRLAALYARVGDKNQAFHYLQEGLERTPQELIHHLNTNPAFMPLRNDARFRELLHRLGL